jgi:hypothetical protein
VTCPPRLTAGTAAPSPTKAHGSGPAGADGCGSLPPAATAVPSKKFTDVVAATIACEQDMIPLGTDQYEVYPEWVRIPPRTGAMVKVARPRLRRWSCSFLMLVDPEMYGKHGVKVLREIIAHAGKMVGLGPWRPSLKGPYGKFTVEGFEING